VAQIVGFVGQSHSPLWSAMPPNGPADPGASFVAAVDRCRHLVEQARPDVIVLFGPDHFRFAFYDMMPRFCIGAERLTSVGDYGTPKGPLPLAAALARSVHSAACAAGFDPALSLNMGIDHGLAQTYAALFPALKTPIVPVMVNTSAPPLPGPARCYAFGRAVGDGIISHAGADRVLVVGSGGLSHWPPSTSAFDTSLGDDEREFLLTGRERVAELEEARERRVQQMGANMSGRINPHWDQWVLRCLAEGDVEPLLRLDEPAIFEQAGNGGQEVRTWLAALGAWDAADAQPAVADRGYEAVPRWITGMGTLTFLAEPVAAAVPA
jgi:2,3-dihydroxyphenylpropionate 1,2-dioxygenase